MHNFIKLFAILPIAFLVSCSAQNVGVKYKIESTEFQTDLYSINGDTITFEGDSDGIKYLNHSISEEIEDWKENFETKVSSVKQFSTAKPQLQFNQKVALNNDKLLCLVTEKYAYITGLHGNSWRSTRVFDRVNDKMLSLQDLFCDNTYQNILNERIEEVIKQNEDEYKDLWEKPIVDEKREDKFYLDEKNLILYYEPYELSYYARGVVEIPISLEKIRGYLKEEYLTKS